LAFGEGGGVGIILREGKLRAKEDHARVSRQVASPEREKLDSSLRGKEKHLGNSKGETNARGERRKPGKRITALRSELAAGRGGTVRIRVFKKILRLAFQIWELRRSFAFKGGWARPDDGGEISLHAGGKAMILF